MSDRARFETLGVNDWVSTTPTGIGESLVMADVERRFQGWRSIQYRITPTFSWHVLSNLEASGFFSPGDAPVLAGLATAGVPAGSMESEQIYARASTAKSQRLVEWENMGVSERSELSSDELMEIARLSAAEAAARNDAAYQAGTQDYYGGLSWAPGEGPVQTEIPEDDFSLFGAIKGTSRWAFLAFDAVPEAIDAMQRAILHVKSGEMSVGEALGGAIGLNPEAGQVTGIPLFQYLGAGLRGERLNMGTGWFAEGQIAPDIEAELRRYDTETMGQIDPVTGERNTDQAREIFQREWERTDGQVIISGPDGQDYRAESFEDWQFLRNNAGRAGLLSTLQYSSPTQDALGQAYGTFNESVFDEGTIAQTTFTPLTGAGSGRTRFVPSAGRSTAALFVEPQSDPFDVLSAPIDLGKQLVDLNLLGVTARGGRTVINGASRFIGQGDEAGQLIRGNRTMMNIIANSDEAALGNVVGDLTAQTLNRGAAANALARGADEPLNAARTFVGAAQRYAPMVLDRRKKAAIAELVGQGVDQQKAINMVGDALTGPQIDALVRRAAQGDAGARVWLNDVMAEAPTKAASEEIAKSIDNLIAVNGRADEVDIVGRNYGSAVVDDEIYQRAVNEVNELADLLEGSKGSVFVSDPAKAVLDPQKGLTLTFDADLGRAQSTLRNLGDRFVERAETARRTLRASDALDRAKNIEAARQRELARLGVGKAIRGPSSELAAAQRAFDEAANEARALGLNPLNPGSLHHAAKMDDLPSIYSRFSKALVNENKGTFDWAVKVLGENDDAVRELRNLQRVLKRNTDMTDIINFAGEIPRHIPEGRIRNLLTGKGAMADMVESLRQAKTMRQVDAILTPSKEFSGRTIDPRLKKLLADADTTEEVVEAIIKAGDTARLIPQRIQLLGAYAKAGNLLTSAGVAGGGVVGALDAADDPDAGIGDIVAGGITGAIAGALAGSSVSGVAGAVGGGLTRNVDTIGDAMDLMLAGTRSATMDILRSRGVEVNRALAGLSSTQQLGYAFGHSAMGRRLARSYRPTVNINDPFDMYYTLSDMMRSFGVASDDVVHVLTRGTGDARETTRLIRSNFDTADEFEDAITRALADGFTTHRTYDFDRAFRRIADLQANNTGKAWAALREVFDGLDNVLVDAGMDPDRARLLTEFARQGGDEFVGNVNAVGQGANVAQGMMVNGSYQDLRNAPLMMSEMWSGNIALPPPQLVHRAVQQLTALGTTINVFTGKGVAPSVYRKLRGLSDDVAWHDVLTPSLERNVATRAARAITGTLWAPAVLLTRPFSFLSRVLGEDQARMTATGLDSIIRHPWNYITAVVSDAKLHASIKPRGIVARSLLPDDFFDDAGRLVEDAYDRLHHLEISERVQRGLGIYNREEAAANKVFGTSHWGKINRGSPVYKRSLTGEFRQLATDPMVRHMAASSADDVVEDTLRWLIETDEGIKTMERWALQFEDPKTAAMYMGNPDMMRAFLEDQHARMHLKTGGDWVYVFDQGGTKVGIDASGAHRTDIDVSQFDPGYVILRGGDPELLGVLGTGSISDMRISGQLNDEVNEAIADLVGRKHDSFENAVESAARAGEDASQYHRFPEVVKGHRTSRELLSEGESSGLIGRWDDALDRFYDWTLGWSTNKFSRQPVLGQYYWERVGLLLPSMTDEVANKFRQLAEVEGKLGRVDEIARAMDEAGVAKGVIDDFDVMDLNAKAYAVERTKDILFDLTRQRNFIDAFRIVAPFTGPMVEALEAWGRVVRGNPVYVWRRGGQLINSLWDSDPLSLERETGFGTFWTAPDGERMVTFPYSGPIMRWMHDNISEGIPAGEVSARARGFNVVFGPDDLADPDQPSAFGAPLAAFNVGTGPGFTLPVAPLLKDREGALAEINEFLFPYGPPNNAFENFLPFHLRKIFEGQLGEQSQIDRVRTAGQRFSAMVAEGQVGEGPQHRFDTTQAGQVQAAWDQAVSDSFWGNLVEGVIRGSVPTMVTPEVYIQLDEMEANGVDTDALMNLTALQEEARALYSEEGAQLITMPDGTQISTEGDWEMVTEYLNQTYGLDVFSAELMTLSPSTTVHPRLYRESGRRWMNQNAELTKIAPNSIQLLMPDYAGVEANEEFSFRALEDAVARGDSTYADIDEYQIEIQSRLLSRRNREIDRTAEEIFGPDDVLEGEAQDSKDAWKATQKAMAQGIYERGVIPVGSDEKVLNELLTWNTRDWSAASLEPAEQATVDAMLWYLDSEAVAASYALQGGVTSITNLGSTEREKEAVNLARAELMTLVENQINYSARNGHDLGNFPYLWERYLKPRLEISDEVDPLEAMAEAASPWGGVLDELRSSDE